MAAPTIRVRILIDSQDPKAWAAALAYADQILQRRGPPARDIILLTHTKQQVGFMPLSGGLGAHAIKGLKQGRDLTFTSGAVLRAETLQTLRSPPRDAVIIAYFADDKMMTTVDGYTNVGGVVVVPDHQDSAEQWVERWNPLVPGQPAQAVAVLIADPKVEKAMEALTGLINRGNGILHPRDKQMADEFLRILRAKGHTTDTAKLKSWAIKNGWPPKAAQELAALAGKVFALKAKPRLTGIYNPDGRYDSWV